MLSTEQGKKPTLDQRGAQTFRKQRNWAEREKKKKRHGHSQKKGAFNSGEKKKGGEEPCFFSPPPKLTRCDTILL